MKLCKTCGKTKGENEFYKHKNTKDGLWPECKECNISRAIKWGKYHLKQKRKIGRQDWVKHREKRIVGLKKSYDNREFGGLREIVLKRDSHKCVKCGMTRKEHLARWGVDINVDHVNRNRKENDMSNLQTICLVCHGGKHSKDNKGKGRFKKGQTPWNKLTRF